MLLLEVNHHIIYLELFLRQQESYTCISNKAVMHLLPSKGLNLANILCAINSNTPTTTCFNRI